MSLLNYKVNSANSKSNPLMKPKTRKQRLRELQSVANQGLNACVIELAIQYLSDFPSSSTAWFIYGESLHNLSRFKDARKAMFKAIKLCPESSEHFQWLVCQMGNIYKESGHFRKAVEWYKKAHEKNPEEATFLIYAGLMFLKLENYVEAEEALRQATLSKEGCIDEAFYNLGVVLIVQRKYEEALFCFEKALEIDPKFKLAKQQRKDVKRVLSNIHESIK
jgi:tetratricopeptide (TPR) repeat protein